MNYYCEVTLSITTFPIEEYYNNTFQYPYSFIEQLATRSTLDQLTPLSQGIKHSKAPKVVLSIDQALASLHSCKVGVATPTFSMSNKFAETIQNHVHKFPLQKVFPHMIMQIFCQTETENHTLMNIWCGCCSSINNNSHFWIIQRYSIKHSLSDTIWSLNSCNYNKALM